MKSSPSRMMNRLNAPDDWDAKKELLHELGPSNGGPDFSAGCFRRHPPLRFHGRTLPLFVR